MKPPGISETSSTTVRDSARSEWKAWTLSTTNSGPTGALRVVGVEHELHVAAR